MNVLYDISILGSIRAHSIPKTGIARVVEELAYQLSGIEDCDLELCSSDSLADAVGYAREDLNLKNLRFPHSDRHAAFLKTRWNVQRTVETSSGLPLISARVKRKLLRHFMSLAKISSDTLDANSLRTADIYHSTYLPIPEQARRGQHAQIFLTIYDMIPALFPQYCNAGLIGLFENIASSIGEDAWLLSISEFTKTDFCNYLKIDPSRVFVTPLAADPDLFYLCTDPKAQSAIRHKYKIPGGPYVLSLCTIAPHKNIDHVIRSFVKLVQEQHLPDLNLVLAGAKGWNYDHIFAEIDGAEALKSQIVVTGFVANEDLAALYTGAMTFVFPSLYEGFGLPPLEAMQCGVPVITSNTSSLPEVVGDAGIMLDPKDADGLCGALLSLYEDADLRADMAAKSLLRAGQFSWKRCAEDTVHAYKTALGQAKDTSFSR